MADGRRVHIEALDERAVVTPLELFFDLVFVFGLTQVTALMADDLTVTGVVRGLLVLGLLWWSWVAYAWIGNVVRADEGAARATLLLAMGTMFVLALAIPEAFDDLEGGLPGPLVVAVCYLVFRLLHLALFWIAAEGDQGLRRQLVRFTPSVLGGTALLLVASQLDGPAQTAAWALALVADYAGTLLAGASGWRLRSAHHFADRHGLILIVALGESIVAIGVGVAALPISWPIVAASALGLATASALWWVYFDVTQLRCERALAGASEQDRPRLARDAYSFLHAPMIVGVVLLALGLKKVLEYVGDGAEHSLADPLGGVGLVALFGGLAVFLLAHAGFELRLLGRVGPLRPAVAVALLVVVPLAARLPALASLAVLAAAAVAVALAQTIGAPDRYEVRHEAA
jgi:low temperature requirement protein LtrA